MILSHHQIEDIGAAVIQDFNKFFYTEEISTKLLERSLRESLTPTQYGIYQACILNGISYKAYADLMGVSYQSVQNAIRLIQKKAKNIFG